MNRFFSLPLASRGRRLLSDDKRERKLFQSYILFERKTTHRLNPLNALLQSLNKSLKREREKGDLLRRNVRLDEHLGFQERANEQKPIREETVFVHLRGKVDNKGRGERERTFENSLILSDPLTSSVFSGSLTMWKSAPYRS